MRSHSAQRVLWDALASNTRHFESDFVRGVYAWDDNFENLVPRVVLDSHPRGDSSLLIRPRAAYAAILQIVRFPRSP